MRWYAAFAFFFVTLWTLACSGSQDEAELQGLYLAFEETQARLAAAELRLQTCSCPDEVPAEAVADIGAPSGPTRSEPAGTGPGEIEVRATNAVKVLVDGKPVSYNYVKSAYIQKNLEPGPHLLELQNQAFRQVAWTETVQVPAGRRLRFQHRLGKKGLDPLGTVDARD